MKGREAFGHSNGGLEHVQVRMHQGGRGVECIKGGRGVESVGAPLRLLLAFVQVRTHEGPGSVWAQKWGAAAPEAGVCLGSSMHKRQVWDRKCSGTAVWGCSAWCWHL